MATLFVGFVFDTTQEEGVEGHFVTGLDLDEVKGAIVDYVSNNSPYGYEGEHEWLEGNTYFPVEEVDYKEDAFIWGRVHEVITGQVNRFSEFA